MLSIYSKFRSNLSGSSASVNSDRSKAWISFTAVGTEVYSCSYKGGYCYMTGTSMASPAVVTCSRVEKSY